MVLSIGYNSETIQAFPAGGYCHNETAGSSSSSYALQGDKVLLVEVYGDNEFHIAFGDSAVTATVNDVYIAAGLQRPLVIPPSATHFAILRAGASDSNVFLTEAGQILAI